jgi:hypothetical protein
VRGAHLTGTPAPRPESPPGVCAGLGSDRLSVPPLPLASAALKKLRFGALSRTLEPAELYDWKASDHAVKVTGSHPNRSWEGLPVFL